MRLRFLNFIAAAAIAISAVSASLWATSYSDTRFLLANFRNGRFDGDKQWRGYYLAAYRGQIAFESERIYYLARPKTPPSGRWSAEDAVDLYTPALRSFPFDGPLGFTFSRTYGVSSSGELHQLRFAFPLWIVLLASSSVLLYRFRKWMVWHRPAALPFAANAAASPPAAVDRLRRRGRSGHAAIQFTGRPRPLNGLRYPAEDSNLPSMRSVRLIALVWLIGGIYVLFASAFSPGVFGSVSAAFGIPAGIGILLDKRWAVWPAMALCFSWAGIAALLLFKGSGFTFNNVTLLVGAVACGLSVLFWFRSRPRPGIIVLQV